MHVMAHCNNRHKVCVQSIRHEKLVAIVSLGLELAVAGDSTQLLNNVQTHRNLLRKSFTSPVCLSGPCENYKKDDQTLFLVKCDMEFRLFVLVLVVFSSHSPDSRDILPKTSWWTALVVLVIVRNWYILQGLPMHLEKNNGPREGVKARGVTQAK